MTTERVVILMMMWKIFTRDRIIYGQSVAGRVKCASDELSSPRGLAQRRVALP